MEATGGEHVQILNMVPYVISLKIENLFLPFIHPSKQFLWNQNTPEVAIV